jgi:hypothetical protein
LWSRWRDPLVIVKPDTVIGWHRQGFKLLWKLRSKLGRPLIPCEHIHFIRTISREHPELGEDQIALELETKLGMRHSPSTIRRYRWTRPAAPQRPCRRSQSWRTFLKNQGHSIWACDFVVQFTALFIPVYIFVIVEIGSRRIVWVNGTTSPSLDWVKAQIRQTCPFEEKPKFLIHDNDGIFGQFRKPAERRPFRCELDRWLSHVMNIRGIPIPYGAPNAKGDVSHYTSFTRSDAICRPGRRRESLLPCRLRSVAPSSGA